MSNLLKQKLQEGKILFNDPIFQEIDRIQAENDRVIVKLNNSYHEKQAVHELMTQITGEPLDPSVTIMLPFYSDFGRHITIGKDVFINRNVMFVDLGGITLEDDVLIGPRVNLVTVNHLEDPAERRGLMVKPIHLKKRAWIGAAATILPGVTIGENAIVAANATVTKDVPDNSIVAGTPARIIRKIHTKTADLA